MTDRWVRLAGATTSGRPLAAVRMLYAVATLALLIPAERRFASGFSADRVHIPWPGIGTTFLGVPPGLVTAAWIIGAVALFVGLWPRVAAALLVGAIVVFYGADQAHYGNSGYFLILIGILLIVADSSASATPWGPDRRRSSWWPAFLLAAQLSIVYAYSAVQKLRTSALAGETVDWQLGGPLVEHITWSGLAQTLNALGGTAEAFCAVALWFPRTRWVAVAVGITLHVGVLAFLRDSPGLVGFGLATMALYPAFWAASPPLGATIRGLRPGCSSPRT